MSRLAHPAVGCSPPRGPATPHSHPEAESTTPQAHHVAHFLDRIRTIFTAAPRARGCQCPSQAPKPSAGPVTVPWAPEEVAAREEWVGQRDSTCLAAATSTGDTRGRGTGLGAIQVASRSGWVTASPVALGKETG